MKSQSSLLPLLFAAAAPTASQAQSIYEIASDSDDFTTLTAAIDAAGLAETLSEDGPFTVFAPTDGAFDDIPRRTLERLLRPQWIFHLQDLLLYHALDSVVTSADLEDGLEVETINAEDIVINLDDDGASITTVSDTTSNILVEEELVDIEADNGIIHVVDSVLLPTSATQNIVDIAVGNEDFSILVEAVVAAGLVDALSGEGPLTVFAPTNEAFQDLPSGTLDRLLRPQNRDELVSLLLYHVVPGNVHSSVLSLGRGHVTTLNGEDIHVRVPKRSNRAIKINRSKVIAENILASNGIIHVIDKVLIPPPEKSSKSTKKSTKKKTNTKGYGWWGTSGKSSKSAKSSKSSGKSRK
mmetsp:Transcript_20596/g.42451  ORF Transcript_20596/g.42451 Transcript_20596/m.42451 type:complete len:354 (-) Transcript_20596:172-1233(-)